LSIKFSFSFFGKKSMSVYVTHEVFIFRSSLERLQLNRLGIGQLHWSTANYAPLQERALWDGLVEMYDKVTELSNIA
jgi:aryl-alcohol dehydrogenase-like predicted oxidoreductase